MYQIDDGAAENAIGLTGGGDIIWLNQFSVTGGNNIILSISVAFSSLGGTGSALLNGLPFTVYLWSDPNNDGSPTDAVVLTSATGTVMNAGTNSFITVNIAPTAIMGSSFFVGALMTHPSGTFPAALNQTAPTFSNRSWVAGGAAGAGNPNNLPANAFFGTGRELQLCGEVARAGKCSSGAVHLRVAGGRRSLRCLRRASPQEELSSSSPVFLRAPAPAGDRRFAVPAPP
ncbi:hypothetical protein BH20VER1_BH20VER1_30190 [soil metagenome]